MKEPAIITDALRELAKKSKFAIIHLVQVKAGHMLTDYGVKVMIRYCFIKNIHIKELIPFSGYYASSDRVSRPHGKKKPNLFMFVQKQYNG